MTTTTFDPRGSVLLLGYNINRVRWADLNPDEQALIRKRVKRFRNLTPLGLLEVLRSGRKPSDIEKR